MADKAAPIVIENGKASDENKENMASKTQNDEDKILIKEKQVAEEKSEQKEERETWGNKIEFILTCVGYCVGLGNVWRFPYLAFKNGGGAFLIPYFIMLLLCGMPLFLMELALGQYFRFGPVSTWNIACPIAKGIGFAMIAVAFLCTVYYNVIVAWVLYYMYASMRKEVPWKYCNNEWNTNRCVQGTRKEFEWSCPPSNNTSNITNTINFTSVATTASSGIINTTLCNKTKLLLKSPSEEYWERHVLQITDELGESGTIRPELFVCLILAWGLVFLCLFKGIKSSGKVVYFTATFPYIVMFILLVRGAMLDGASLGVEYYLKPDFSKLANAEVWVAAATQIFYSLGIGFGSLIAFGSYNKFNNNVVRDAVALSLVNCFTSVFAGLVVFCVLGNMAYKTGMDIELVATSGPGLVFVVYPEGLSNMPISPLWGILFFFMILTIGLDTQFAMLEAVIIGFVDEYKILGKKKVWFTLAVCILACLFGISMVMQGGMYVLNLFNWQSGGVSLLFLAFFEVIAVAYGYGADRFERDLEVILGRKPLIWWKLCWKYFSPAIIFAIFVSSLIQWKGVTYNSYQYPAFGEFIGWMLALFSMAWIPIIAIYKLVKSEGTLVERFKQLSRPDEERLRQIAAERNEDIMLEEKI